MFVCIIILAFALCLYIPALFIMRHKYRIRHLAYDKTDARQSDSMRVRCHFKKWQVLIGWILMFLPIVNIIVGLTFLMLAMPNKNERTFIWSDNARTQRILVWLTEDF